MHQYCGGVCSGFLVPLPTPVLLGQTYNGGMGRRIIWHPIQGLLRGDPGGTAIFNHIQHGSRCGPPTLFNCGGIDRLGSGPWRGCHGGFRAGHAASSSIFLC